MNWEHLVDSMVERPAVDTLSDGLQKVVAGAFGSMGGVGRGLQNFLHGTWLGHPLHPVLTDIPLGAFSAAAVLDAVEGAGGHLAVADGVDVVLTLGVAGGLAAALAGLTDWHVSGQHARRVGVVHALFNTAAITLYIVSFIARRNGARGFGRVLAYSGYLTLFGGAYLGGHLVFAQQIGVDHVKDQPEPEQFEAVISVEELGDDTLRCVQVGEASVMVVRHEGQVYAMADVCSHLGCSLAEGHLDGDSVRCDCHGSRYALADGRVLDGPSTYWQPSYRVRIRNGQIEIGQREYPS